MCTYWNFPRWIDIHLFFVRSSSSLDSITTQFIFFLSLYEWEFECVCARESESVSPIIFPFPFYSIHLHQLFVPLFLCVLVYLNFVYSAKSHKTNTRTHREQTEWTTLHTRKTHKICLKFNLKIICIIESNAFENDVFVLFCFVFPFCVCSFHYRHPCTVSSRPSRSRSLQFPSVQTIRACFVCVAFEIDSNINTYIGLLFVWLSIPFRSRKTAEENARMAKMDDIERYWDGRDLEVVWMDTSERHREG